MSVSILLITHNDIGSALIKAATATFGELPLATTAIPINYNTDPEEMLAKLARLIKKIDQGDGVMILTDIYGSTPSNIAQRLQKEFGCEVIAGLNLPMLIKIMNYPNLKLDMLAQKALSGGREGVIDCSHHLGSKENVKEEDYHH